jgi:membrane-bound lytic murein transglycosylase B
VTENKALKRLKRSIIALVLSFWGEQTEALGKSLPFEEWKEKLGEEACEAGIEEATLEKAWPYVILNPQSEKSDKKQLKKITFEAYYKYATPQLLKKWARKVRKNRVLLEQAGRKYGVEPQYIAAIWAVESRCGQVMGNFNVLSALTTLAYEGRREEFFKKELLTALKLLQTLPLDPDQFKGSWAGAMGQCQFMPTSYEKYAVDEDRDGYPNIWSSSEDVFGSIANYLKGYGWRTGLRWGRRVKIPASLYEKVTRNPEVYQEPRQLKDWRKMGVVELKGRSLPSSPLTAQLICPLSKKKKAYLVYSNFEVIKKYNNSTFYALSVGLLADYFKQTCWPSPKSKKDE